MAEPPRYVPPQWKIIENFHARQEHARLMAEQRGQIELAGMLRDAEKDATAAREHKAIVQNPFCAGHDFVREWKERTGQIKIERSHER